MSNLEELRALTRNLEDRDRELRRDFNFLNAVVDNISAMILVFDFFGNVIMMNPECSKVLGYTAKELNKERMFFIKKIVPEDEQPGVADVFNRLITNQLPISYINNVRTKTGSIKTISWRNSIVDIGKNQRIIIAFGIDISNQVKERTRLDSIIDNISDAIVTIDENGIIQGWNPAAEKIFGYTEEEMMQGDLLPILGDEIIGGHKEAVKRVSQGNDAYKESVTRTGKRKDGSEVTVSLRLNRWRTNGDIFITGVMREINSKE